MKIEVCKGQAGLALYVDDERVAGVRHNGLMETVLSATVDSALASPAAISGDGSAPEVGNYNHEQLDHYAKVYASPSRADAVTEAMVEAARNAVLHANVFISHEHMRAALTAALATAPEEKGGASS